MSDLYGALGIDRDATTEDVRKAYRKKAKGAHPDSGGSVEEFALVCRAKDILSDKARRSRYDRTGDDADVGPDQTDSMALNLAMQSIFMVIAKVEQRYARPESFDILGDAIKNIEQAISGMQSQDRDLRTKAAKTKKGAARFSAKKKGEPNVIRTMMERHAADLEGQATAALRPVESHKLAIKILKDHSFSIDPGQAMPNPLNLQPMGPRSRLLSG